MKGVSRAVVGVPAGFFARNHYQALHSLATRDTAYKVLAAWARTDSAIGYIAPKEPAGTPAVRDFALRGCY
jgi:hypothetical protein